MHAKLLFCALLAVAAQEKTYDVKLEAKPVKGHKSDQYEKATLKMSMKVNGQAAGDQVEETVFSAAEEILDVDSDGQAKRRWVFTRATHLHDGKPEAYGFQGKTVIRTAAKGKPTAYAYEDGGALGEHDLEGIKDAFDSKGTGKGGSELFSPPKPVKAGESWSGDIKKIAAAMFDDEMAGGVDLTQSKLSFTLKSVESRGGVDFGKVAGVMELAFTSMGAMKFEQPMVMKFTVDIDGCIDGKLPDGIQRLKGEMKGKTAATAQGNKIEVQFDMSLNAEKTVKSAK